MVDCGSTLSYLQEVFQPAAGTCQEPRSLTSRLAPCSYVLNLGWSLYFFLCLFFPPPTFHCSTATISRICVVSQFGKPCRVFVSMKNHSLFFPHTPMAYCICNTKPPIAQPLSRQSSSGSVELEVAHIRLAFDTRHK